MTLISGRSWLAVGLALIVVSGCAVDPTRVESVRSAVLVVDREATRAFVEGPSIEVPLAGMSPSVARSWIQWTAQPDPTGARHGLRIHVIYSGIYRLYTAAATGEGDRLESFNLFRDARSCSDDPLVPNCEFVEALHVSIPAGLAAQAAIGGLDIELTSASGVRSRLNIPAAYVAGIAARI